MDTHVFKRHKNTFKKKEFKHSKERGAWQCGHIHVSFVHRDVELSHLHPQVRTQTGHSNQMREVSQFPVAAFVCSYADRSQEPEG